MEDFDIVIIGSGCAGLAAAMYCGRFTLKTLVLGDIPGGVIITTDIVENYPGFIKLTGQELADKIMEHAKEYPTVEIKNEKVLDVNKKGNYFIVKSDEGEYKAKTLLFATGTRWRKLGVPGEEKYSNKGVHYCMLCDGFFYKDRTIGVVGGADSAAKEAILGTQYAKKIYIIYRGDTIRPEPVNMLRIEKLMKEGKIEIINNTNILEIKGNGRMSSVIFDKPYKGSKELKLEGLFIEVGHIPLSELAVKLGVKTDEKGEIVINRDAQTNVPGIFAAGDVVDTKFKQAITGVGEAVVASYSAYQYIKSNESIYPTSAPDYHGKSKAVEEKEIKRVTKQIKK